MRSGTILVHLGRSIPAFLGDAIRQAAFFSDDPVYFVAERRALAAFAGAKGLFQPIAAEDLDLGTIHRSFRRNLRVPATKVDLWISSMERFFYVRAVMSELSLENAVQLETDVMVYADVRPLAARMADLYQGIALPFMDNRRVIPSVVFLRNARAVEAVCDYIVHTVHARPGPGLSEMEVIRRAYADLGRAVVDSLPILPEGHHETMITRQGEAADDPAIYSQNAAALGYVFDAAAIGQYLAGPDRRHRKRVGLFRKAPIHPEPTPGFLNESSYMDASRFEVSWSADGKGRMIPTLSQHQGAPVPLANIHLHSKHLGIFASDRREGGDP